MNLEPTLHVTALRPGPFGPGSDYADAVWLPCLGPRAFEAWRQLALELNREPTGITVHLADLSGRLGIGSPHGSHSAARDALRRLGRSGVLVPTPSPAAALLKVDLPFVPERRLQALPDRAQRIHHEILTQHQADAQPSAVPPARRQAESSRQRLPVPAARLKPAPAKRPVQANR